MADADLSIVEDLNRHLGDDSANIPDGLLDELVKIAFVHQYQYSTAVLVAEIKKILANFGYPVR